MNRVALFRAKRKMCGTWVYGYYVVSDGDHFIYVDDENKSVFEVIPETVGQFTGFEDSYGTRIFEGNKLHFEGTDFYYSVRFEDGCFVLYNEIFELKGVIWGNLKRAFDEDVKRLFSRIKVVTISTAA